MAQRHAAALPGDEDEGDNNEAGGQRHPAPDDGRINYIGPQLGAEGPREAPR